MFYQNCLLREIPALSWGVWVAFKSGMCPNYIPKSSCLQHPGCIPLLQKLSGKNRVHRGMPEALLSIHSPDQGFSSFLFPLHT